MFHGNWMKRPYLFKSGIRKSFDEWSTLLRMLILNVPCIQYSTCQTGCASAHSTRASKECTNPCRTISIDIFRTIRKLHKHGCTLNRAQKKSVVNSRMHEMVNGKLIERQLARQSKMSVLQWCDSAGKHRQRHSARRPVCLNQHPEMSRASGASNSLVSSGLARYSCSTLYGHGAENRKSGNVKISREV